MDNSLSIFNHVQSMFVKEHVYNVNINTGM